MVVHHHHVVSDFYKCDDVRSAEEQTSLLLRTPTLAEEAEAATAATDGTYRHHHRQYNNGRRCLTVTQWCFVLSTVCAIWNLFGDLYYLDYFYAYTSLDFVEEKVEGEGDSNEGFDIGGGGGGTTTSSSSVNSYGFAAISSSQQTTPRPGNIFDFSSSSSSPYCPSLLAQSGGWMYPLWALVTIIPLVPPLLDILLNISLKKKRRSRKNDGTSYNNNSSNNNNDVNNNNGTTFVLSDAAVALRRVLVPCLILLYGLCIVGGSLHSGMIFLTILPDSYYTYTTNTTNTTTNGSSNHYYYCDADGGDVCDGVDFMNGMQSHFVEKVFWGCWPGILATNVGAIWIGYIVQFQQVVSSSSSSSSPPPATTTTTTRKVTILPRWFNFFHPLCTNIWLPVMSNLVLSPTASYYMTGCLGTWSLYIWNIGTFVCLGLPRRQRQPSEQQQQQQTGRYYNHHYYDGPERLWKNICCQHIVPMDLSEGGS